MGFSENGSKRAAIAVKNSSGEAAMEWVFACRSAVKRGPSLYIWLAGLLYYGSRPSLYNGPLARARPPAAPRRGTPGVGGVHPALTVPSDHPLTSDHP